ncbi:g8156 [Coccomyxa viridis]|uniref:G8156 protein n=1 Tax=Coccomyxa viridis TaxID=1274662 RepID=A0ABP1FZN1_9CHLO
MRWRIPGVGVTAARAGASWGSGGGFRGLAYWQPDPVHSGGALEDSRGGQIGLSMTPAVIAEQIQDYRQQGRREVWERCFTSGAGPSGPASGG